MTYAYLYYITTGDLAPPGPLSLKLKNVTSQNMQHDEGVDSSSEGRQCCIKNSYMHLANIIILGSEAHRLLLGDFITCVCV